MRRHGHRAGAADRPAGAGGRRPHGAAEELGFSHGWTFDSHVLWQEPYVILSQVLARTSRLVVGPMVTNPATRDWTVIASLHATLTRCTATGRSAASAGATPRCGCRAGRRRRWPGSRTRSRDPRAGRGAVGGRRGHVHTDPVGPPGPPAGLGGRVRAEGAGADRPLRRRLHPPARRPLPRGVDREVGARRGGGGRPRPRRADDLRGRPGVRRRRPGARPRPVPLVRRDGGQPRRRSGHALRRERRRCPRS